MPSRPRNGVPSGSISSAEKREEAWRFCAVTIERHYDEMLRRWNAELDMLLVFAGLFSAALTAFNVQSYLLLQPDNSDTTVQALVRISAQLESFSVNANFVNSTRSSFLPPAPTAFTAPLYAVWINALWFSALTCTLSATSIAVTVKQWLQRYAQGLSGTSAEVARLRQYRYDSLLKWRVPWVIAALPILLQVAVALFFAGLLILLYNLHAAVSLAVSLLVATLLVFTLTTTALPAIYTDCCYRSPQALSILLLFRAARKVSVRCMDGIERKAKAWAADTVTGSPSYSVIASNICLAARTALDFLEKEELFVGWEAHEKTDVSIRHEELEQSIALTTYQIVSDKTALSSVIVPCLSGMDSLSERMSVQYGELLIATTDRLKRAEWATWRPALPFVLVVLSLIVKEPRPGAVQRVLSIMPEHRVASAKSNLGMLFLLSMANLATNGIAARAAFENMLRYLRHAGIDQETSTTLGRTVLHDVEVAFPTTFSQLEDLVNLDDFAAIGHYLTGVECVVIYLMHHRKHMGELLLPAEDRVAMMLRGYRCFLQCPAWRNTPSRRENVLWGLRASRLPELVLQLWRARDVAGVVQDEASKSASMLQEALSDLQRGFDNQISTSPISSGTREALADLKAQFEGFDKGQGKAEGADVHQLENGPAAEITSQGERSLLRVSPADPEAMAAPSVPSSTPNTLAPALAQSRRTSDATGSAEEVETDIVDLSDILASDVYWDETSDVPGLETVDISEGVIPSPVSATHGNDYDDSEGDPVLPRFSNTPFRHRRFSMLPSISEDEDIVDGGPLRSEAGFSSTLRLT